MGIGYGRFMRFKRRIAAGEPPIPNSPVISRFTKSWIARSFALSPVTGGSGRSSARGSMTFKDDPAARTEALEKQGGGLRPGGDVVAAGGNLYIGKQVQGDVMAAGGTIRITGEVFDDIRTAGGDVEIDALTGDGLIVAGGKIRISP